jgi:hypothetical protein
LSSRTSNNPPAGDAVAGSARDIAFEKGDAYHASDFLVKDD